MRRWLVWIGGILAALVLVGGGAIYLMRGDISLAMLRRGAEETLKAPASASLPAGLNVGFCGTGSPLPDRSRAGPCTFVQAGEQIFVFDAGEGAAETMSLMGFSPGEVTAVYLTHLHSDHIDGLGPMALQHWAQGAARAPLALIGPPGVERVAAGFNEVYAIDSGYRVAHHGETVLPRGGFGMAAQAVAIPDGQEQGVVYDSGGVRIIVFLVEHEPVHPAYGYRVDYAGRSVVISGDTSKTERMTRAARGADLLVHEALSPTLVAVMEEAARAADRAGVAKIFADIPSYHTSPEEAAEIARDAGVRTLALTHLIPAMPIAGLDVPFLGRAPQIFGGDVWIMRDGDVISLPESGGVQRRNLLP